AIGELCLRVQMEGVGLEVTGDIPLRRELRRGIGGGALLESHQRLIRRREINLAGIAERPVRVERRKVRLAGDDNRPARRTARRTGGVVIGTAAARSSHYTQHYNHEDSSDGCQDA